MSFLYDKKVYSDIVERAFPKLGQQAPTAINPALLPKLVRRLDAEMSPVQTDTFSIGKGDEATGAAPEAGAGLTLNDLTVDNLVKFLNDHKIMFSTGGPKERIVYSQGDFQTIPQDQKEYFDKVGTYMVNPVLFANYVKYLQGNLAKKNNPLINARLKMLIDDVNNRFPDAELSRTQKSETPDFPDNMELDKVNNVFDSKEPAGDGAVPLTVGNLKNKEALNGWLQAHQAQVVTHDDKGGVLKELYAKAKDLDAAWDAIINSLYKRAARLRKLANTQDLVKKYDYYMSLLANLGAKGGPGTSTYGGPTQQAGYNQSNGMQQQDFEKIVGSLPLGNDINLTRIQGFFDVIKGNYKDPRSLPVINSYISAAQDAMNKLGQIANNLYIVPENTVPKDLAMRLNRTADYGPAINLLYVILNNTRQVIATIASTYPQLAQTQTLQDQVNFYYGRNRAFLGDLLRDANQILAR
jgi:hypothetical protein